MESKNCPRCSQPKPFSEFHKCRRNPDGLQTYCKTCHKTLIGPRGYDRAQYLRQRERRLKAWTQYKTQNLDTVRATQARMRRKYAGKRAAHKARWRADKRHATPSWANKSELRAIYEGAEYVSRLTGVRFEVDHVIPLRSPLVCGLHVPANLQYLTRAENGLKANRF